jgi:hypothetical protein
MYLGCHFLPIRVQEVFSYPLLQRGVTPIPCIYQLSKSGRTQHGFAMLDQRPKATGTDLLAAHSERWHLHVVTMAMRWDVRAAVEAQWP